MDSQVVRGIFPSKNGKNRNKKREKAGKNDRKKKARRPGKILEFSFRFEDTWLKNETCYLNLPDLR